MWGVGEPLGQAKAQVAVQAPAAVIQGPQGTSPVQPSPHAPQGSRVVGVRQSAPLRDAWALETAGHRAARCDVRAGRGEGPAPRTAGHTHASASPLLCPQLPGVQAGAGQAR